MDHVIDESNYGDAIAWMQHISDPTLKNPTPGCLPRKTAYGAIPGVPRATELLDPIPRTEWPKMIEEGRGSWLNDLIRDHLPTHDQGSTNYCWAHGPTRGLECLRFWEGQSAVTLSAESVAVPVTGGVNRGGSLDEALDRLIHYGACPQEYWPLNDRNEQHAKEGWQDAALDHRIIRWADVSGFDMQMTFALLRIPVPIGLSWWGHAVCQLDPVMFDDGTFGIGCDNSWGADYGDRGYFVLTERRGTADLGSFAPLSATFLANYKRKYLNSLFRSQAA
jgi:hypothetical protein